MSCTIVCGGFWVDEEKGQVVSYLSWTDEQDAAAGAHRNEALNR